MMTTAPSPFRTAAMAPSLISATLHPWKEATPYSAIHVNVGSASVNIWIMPPYRALYGDGMH